MLKSSFLIFLYHWIIFQVVDVIGQSLTTSSAFNRVFGTSITSMSEYPHHVSIYFKSTQRVCSGSILNQTTILTSGLCTMYYKQLSDIKIRAGSVSRVDGGQMFDVDRVIVYPSFQNLLTSDYNIALLILSKPIEFSTDIQPVTLPEECEKFPTNTSVTVIGWRKIKGGGEFSQEIKRVDYPLVDKKTCIEKYEKPKDSGLTASRTFCAGYLEDGRTGCSTSGSAALVNFRLYGIYVWSRGCGSISYPDVFTSIAAYRGWIRAVTHI